MIYFLGEYSWRASKTGSWFMQSFCDVMDVAGKQLEFQQSLTRVRYLVSHYYESSDDDPKANKMKQSPIVVSTLSKELYFS